MKKIITLLLVAILFMGIGCNSDANDEQNERWRELAVEFATHQGPALHAGEDVTPSEDLYLEAVDLYTDGHYEAAIDKAEEAVDWLIENGY